MKKLFSLLFLFCLAFVTQAQPVSAFTPPSGYIDSATVKYATATISGGGTLWINTTVTKVANTGTTVAGYAILQVSDGTNEYVNCPTTKLTGPSTAGVGIDTFTFANVTTAQGYSWLVNTPSCPNNHFGYKYRIKYVVTTTKLSATAGYVRR